MRLINCLILIMIGIEVFLIDGLFQLDFNVSLVLSGHLLVTLIITALIYYSQPYFENPHPYLMLLGFFLCFTLPVFGSITILLLINWLRRSQKAFRTIHIHTLPLTKIYTPLKQRRGIGSLTAQLFYNDKKAIEDMKLNALNDAVMLNPQKINPIIRTLLSDKQDEIRLLAFQLLNKQENELLPHINDCLKSLETAHTPAAQFFYQKELACLYWELDFRGLIEEKLSNFTLNKSLNYGKAALILNPSDLSLLLLLGRIYLKLKDYASAHMHFELYITHGGFKDRVISYLAEIYFYEKKYQNIKQLITDHQSQPTLYLNDDFVHFWNPSYV